MQKAAESDSESYLVLLNYRTAPLQHVLLLADILLNRMPKANMFAQLGTDVRFNIVCQYAKIEQSFNRSHLLYLTGIQQIKKNKRLVKAKILIVSTTPWKGCWLYILWGSVATSSVDTGGGGFVVMGSGPRGNSRAFLCLRRGRSIEFEAALLTPTLCGEDCC